MVFGTLLVVAAGTAGSLAPAAHGAADEPTASLTAVTVTAGGAMAVGAHSISPFLTPICGVNMYETRTSATRWRPKTMPSPGSCAWLDSVIALPHHRAWAVGYKISGGKPHTLTEYFNGSRWKVEPSPNPGATEDILAGVAVTRSGTVYAVGHSESASFTIQSLVLKRTGSHWTRMTAPGAAWLTGVTATPSGEVWAVGYTQDPQINYDSVTMKLTPNGWKLVPSPSPGGANPTYPLAVASGKGHALWAVGYYFDASNRQRTLTMRYQHGAWAQVAAPSPGSADFLYSAVVTAKGTVWAVGADTTSKCGVGLTESFAGGHWKVVKSPHVGKCDEQNPDALYGVAATHSGTLYAVGQGGIRILVEQYSGGHWKVIRSSS